MCVYIGLPTDRPLGLDLGCPLQGFSPPSCFCPSCPPSLHLLGELLFKVFLEEVHPKLHQPLGTFRNTLQHKSIFMICLPKTNV